MAIEKFKLYDTADNTLKQWARALNFLFDGNLDNSNIASVSSTSITLAANQVKASNIDFGTGVDQVDASDILIIDSSGYYAASNVEVALREIYEKLKYENVTTKTITATLTSTEFGTIICNSTANITINLPTAVGITGVGYNITNTAAFTVTIDPAGVETLQGDATFPLYQDENLDIVSNGSNWFIK